MQTPVTRTVDSPLTHRLAVQQRLMPPHANYHMQYTIRDNDHIIYLIIIVCSYLECSFFEPFFPSLNLSARNYSNKRVSKTSASSWYTNGAMLQFLLLSAALRGAHQKLVGAIVDDCAAHPVFLATERHPIFREVESMLRSSLTALGHTVVDVHLPECIFLHRENLNRRAARDCGRDMARWDDRGSAVGEAALTITTTFCASSSGYFEHFGPNTIIYQLEPLLLDKVYSVAARACCRSPERLDVMSGKVVWEYTHANIAAYNTSACPLSPRTLVEVLPLLFYDGLEISRHVPKGLARYRNIHDGRSIDVLLIGGFLLKDRRHALLSELQKVSPSLIIVITDTVYDDVRRQAIIMRSKIVVNIHRQVGGDTRPHNEPSCSYFPLESVRLQYLLSLGSFVISEDSWTADMLPFVGGVVFAPYNELIDTILDWLARPESERAAVARKGGEVIRSRTMVQVLRGHMERAVLHLTKRECRYRA